MRCLSSSSVSTLPQAASHAKNPIFGGMNGFHNEREGNSIAGEGSNLLYMILTENHFSLTPFKNNMSSPEGLKF